MTRNKIVKIHTVQSQHGSIIVVIPLIVRSALELDPGDYIMFELDRDTNKVELKKFDTREAVDG